jgi:hypothetical protein
MAARQGRRLPDMRLLLIAAPMTSWRVFDFSSACRSRGTVCGVPMVLLAKDMIAGGRSASIGRYPGR